MDESTPPDPDRELARLDDGYYLRYSGPDRSLELHAPDGRMCVLITLTPEGPRIELHATSLAVHTEHDLALHCRRFEIEAREGMALRTRGDLALSATGTLVTDALEQHHLAHRGDIRMRANDDVQLDGERIRLNSPKPGS